MLVGIDRKVEVLRALFSQMYIMVAYNHDPKLSSQKSIMSSSIDYAILFYFNPQYIIMVQLSTSQKTTISDLLIYGS